MMAADISREYRAMLQKRIESLERIAKLAGMVVLETPDYAARSKSSVAALVRYSLIDELKNALDDGGFDMNARRKVFTNAMRIETLRRAYPPHLKGSKK